VRRPTLDGRAALRSALTLTVLAGISAGVMIDHVAGPDPRSAVADLASSPGPDVTRNPSALDAGAAIGPLDSDLRQQRRAAAQLAVSARAAAVRSAAAQSVSAHAIVAQAAAAQVAAARQAAAAQASRDATRDPRGAARLLLADRGWGGDQFGCLDALWTKESGWNYQASNASSGAYGIPQALPGGKMAGAGSDWQTNPVTQIRWGMDYIAAVYGTPCGAWQHSRALNWY
jgi:hypothetical protein